MAKSKLCPCGSGHLLAECCLPIHDGQLIATTPEELMRSRYTAYALNNLQYIENTMRGRALEEFQQNSENSANIKWLKLEVLASSVDMDNGIVEFKAYYRFNGHKYCLHEVSEFELIDGHWYYSAAREFRE